MAFKPVSTSVSGFHALSILSLNKLFITNFSEKSIKTLCKENSIAEKDVYERISVLLLDILGDANQKIAQIIPKMADHAFQAAFRARCVRHLVYVEGWKNNMSLVDILKDRDINLWYQKLNFDTSRNPDDRVIEEQVQTFRFLADPQEAWSWKGARDSFANPLYQKRIEQRKQLYAFIDAGSCALNETTAIHLGSLIYKDIALYVDRIPLTWLEALQDWVQLCHVKKQQVDALLQLLPLKIFHRNKDVFFLSEGIIAALNVFLKEHTPLSFQRFIAFATLCALEQSLQLPLCSIDRTTWIAKCCHSEHLRSRLMFYSSHKIALLPQEPATAFHADESDLLSFHFLACLDAERGLTIKSSEIKEEKRIPVASSFSPLFEMRLYLLQIILVRDRKWDKKLFAYFSCPSDIPAATAQKRQLLARNKIDHLKQSGHIPDQYKYIFFMMFYKEERRFKQVEGWLLCVVQGMALEEHCEIGLREEIAELVPFFTQLAKNPSFPLTHDQVKRDIRLFLENKKTGITCLKYLHSYEEFMGKPLAPLTSERLRSEDLSFTLDPKPTKQDLKDFSLYLSSEYCSSLEEMQKIHLWFKWINDAPPPSQFASISTTISALTQYLAYVPRSDLYFLLRNLRGCKTQADHLEYLFSIRKSMMEDPRRCIIRRRLIELWEKSLNSETVFLDNPLFLSPDLQQELEPFNARMQQNFYKATFLPLQLVTDCFYIEGIGENSIAYPDGEMFYNHGGQLKQVLPSIFVAVNWEPHAGSAPLMLSLFFLNARTKQGRWLFHPLNISPAMDPQVQRSFFRHLKQLAVIVLDERGAKKGLKKSGDITPEDVSKCYPEAIPHLQALDQIKTGEIALEFLMRLKIDTRIAWWNMLSVCSPEKEEVLCVEKERKMREPLGSSSNGRGADSAAIEFPGHLIGHAKTAIQQHEKEKDLAKIHFGEGVEAMLSLSSTDNKNIDGNCLVRLSCVCEKRVVTLSALDYPVSFLKDDAAFALLFSKHVLGLRTKSLL